MHLDMSQYPRIYLASNGWRLFLGILGGSLCIAGILGVWYFGTGHEVHNTFGFVFLVGISVFMAILGLYVATAVFREKVVLTSDAIEVVGIFKTTRIWRHEISSYRLMSTQGINYIEIIFGNTGIKRIRVTILFRPDEQFSNWFEGLEDLNRKEHLDSLRKIKQNPAFGETTLVRIANNRRARKTAQVLNFVVYVEAVWALFYPHPYTLMVLIVAITPWIAIGLCNKYGDLFSINDPGANSAEADLTGLLLLPGPILCLRAIADYRLLDVAQLIVPSIIGGLIIVSIAAWVSSGLRTSLGKLAFLAVLQATYVGGLTTIANVNLDKAQSKDFRATVLSKRHATSKGPKNFLTVSPWGPVNTNSEISVTCGLYEHTTTGDSVSIYLHPGLLGMPWYVVDDSQNC